MITEVAIARVMIWFWIVYFAAGVIGCSIIVVKNLVLKNRNTSPFLQGIMTIFAIIGLWNTTMLVVATVFGGQLDYGSWQIMLVATVVGILSLPIAIRYKTINEELKVLQLCFVKNN